MPEPLFPPPPRNLLQLSRAPRPYNEEERAKTLWAMRERPQELRNSIREWVQAFLKLGPTAGKVINNLLHRVRGIRTAGSIALFGAANHTDFIVRCC